jgi:methionine aminopeptidase
MTTITIDRKLLEEIVELFDDAISTRYPHEILRDIRAALAAPATAPECKTSGGDARAVALARLLDQAYERGVAVGLSQAVPATAPEPIDPADLCDVCKEPVRYGSRHHTCGEAMLRAALSSPATAPKHNPDCRTCQKFINPGDGCVTVAKCEIGSMYPPVSPIYLWETL